jgi:hypothetical protein
MPFAFDGSDASLTTKRKERVSWKEEWRFPGFRFRSRKTFTSIKRRLCATSTQITRSYALVFDPASATSRGTYSTVSIPSTGNSTVSMGTKGPPPLSICPNSNSEAEAEPETETDPPAGDKAWGGAGGRKELLILAAAIRSEATSIGAAAGRAGSMIVGVAIAGVAMNEGVGESWMIGGVVGATIGASGGCSIAK